MGKKILIEFNTPTYFKYLGNRVAYILKTSHDVCAIWGEKELNFHCYFEPTKKNIENFIRNVIKGEKRKL